MKTISLACLMIVGLAGSGFGQGAVASGFFTASDGVKLRYLTAGSTGSWVVLIHGYMDSAQRMWFNTGIAPALAQNIRLSRAHDKRT